MAADHVIRAISAWLVEQGLLQTPIEIMVSSFCEQAEAAGLSIMRVNIATRTFYPVIESVGHIWTRDESISVEPHPYSNNQLDNGLNSPLKTIVDARTLDMVRRDLIDPQNRKRWPILEGFHQNGGTGHAVKLIGFGSGSTLNGRDSIMTTWMTDRPGGFGDNNIDALKWLIPRLAIAIKSSLDRMIARNIPEVYVGRGAGTEILEGSFRRGDYRIISAAVLVSDHQGLLGLLGQLGPDRDGGAFSTSASMPWSARSGRMAATS